MANTFVCSILLLSFCANLPAAIPWHHPLSLANGGYWPERIAVTVTNLSRLPLAGKPVSFSMPTLTGAQVEALRVCRADGVELLFDLRDAGGSAKHAGRLQIADTLVVPVDCAPHSTAVLFVYAGNTNAWALPDFLPSRPRLEAADIKIAVGDIELLRLAVGPVPTGKPGKDWRNSAEVRLRNLEDRPQPSVLVRVNLLTALTCLPGVPLDTPVLAAGADGTELPVYVLGPGTDLLFAADLPARSEQYFHLGLPQRANSSLRDPVRDYADLLSSRANLLVDGSFETGDEVPNLWRKSPVRDPNQLKAGFASDARFGKRCIELVVPENPRGDWLGWHSREIPVKPGATYLLSGWLKAVKLQGSATLHAHFHNASGALTTSGAMVSSRPAISDTSDWVSSKGLFRAPPDAATIQLHLTMNTQGTVRHDGVLLCEVLDGQVTTIHSAKSKSPKAGLHVWEVNPIVKVFPNTPPQAGPRRLSIELGRNEYEPFQLALRAPVGMTGRVEIAVSTLEDKAGASLPPVKVDRVAFVPIDHPSAYYSTDVPDWCRKVPRGAGATDGWAGLWPDPLAPISGLELQPDQTQPVWFTVRAPSDARPGDYRAEITFRTLGERALSIPLQVRVLPFTLSKHTHLRAIFDLRFGPGGTFGSGASSREERRRWLQFISEHRLGIDAISPSPKFSYQDGRVTMDATDFDEDARLCFDELGMNVAYTPRFFYMFGWAYPPKRFFGLEPFTAEWTAAFKQAYQLFTAHVREKGWHDKFVYYISDEPHFQHEFIVEQMKKLCALIHEVDPRIPIYSSTWRHCSAWDDALDLWGVGQYGCFPVAEMERLARSGKQFWFTCDGQMATDTPYLATERLLPYYCLKFGAQGFEFWGLAWWTYDPWQIGWHQFIRQSDEGKKYYWVRYPDGDGFLAYPGKPFGVDGPVSTIRLEQVREGLEDYEAMTLLVELAGNARLAGKPSASAERALAMAKELVSIPNAGGLRSTEILPDPDRVPLIRKAVNEALTELSRSF